MTIKRVIILALFGILPASVFSGNKYWIVFRDKETVNFNPYEFFDSRVITKRLTNGIPLVQFSDLPVSETYCLKISKYSEISLKSRWLNAVAAELTSQQVSEIEKLDFVSEVRKMQMVSRPFSQNDEDPEDTTFTTGITRQIGIHGAGLFHNREIDGKGVRIAVFDGGFPGVDTLPMFRHLFEEGRIIDTYDFVHKRPFVYDYNSHGTSVLACIAGKLDDKYYGMAPGAEFLLARTEVNSEIFAEEEYWAAAMEWAEKNGADIISSSLGYTYHRYFPKQMDGKTVFVTRMANLAARKGMLVVNAAGNDGDSEWEVISAPADADSVLTVGGISSKTGIHIDFSSFGPTYDGRMKPNVVAFGDVQTIGKKSIKTSYGTSFSTPIVTGFAACVMQLNPQWTNMQVFREIEKSGHLYPYYDYAHGYGVPQAAHFLGLDKKADTTFQITRDQGSIIIQIESDSLTDKLTKADETSFFYGEDVPYLYFHFADKESGKIRKYKVIRMDGAESYSIDPGEGKEGEQIVVHYKGFTESIIL